MRITRALIYWQGRWITEDMRLASLLKPEATFARDTHGQWCLVLWTYRPKEYDANNITVSMHGNTLRPAGV